jgi:tetratricopeptide (TPR) repeat protein
MYSQNNISNYDSFIQKLFSFHKKRAKLLPVFILCAISILLLWLSDAKPEIPHQNDTAVVSRTDFLRLVEALISDGRLDEAKRLVGDLPEDGPLAIDRLFLSAKIAEAEGDYELAEKLYRVILRDNPGLHRVRLDLAHSLFARGNLVGSCGGHPE